MISGQADAKTAKRAHDDAKLQLTAARTAARPAPARPAAPRVSIYEVPVASAFASPELAAQLAQDGVTVRAICEWIVDKVPGFEDESVASGSPFRRAFQKGVSKVLNDHPEYVFRWVSGKQVWRRLPVSEMDLEAPSPAVVAPTSPRAPPDVAWGFDTPVWSVEAKFTSNLAQSIQIGHYYEDHLTVLDRMKEVHGLVVVAETADEKFALVGATPKIAAGIRSGKFWAATQGEDCFFVTVESDARRLT